MTEIDHDAATFQACLALADIIDRFLVQNEKALDTLDAVGVLSSEYNLSLLRVASQRAQEARIARIAAARNKPVADGQPHRFRKKPVVIEAMRYTDAASCGAIHEWMGDPEHHDDGACGESPFVIDTLEGGMEASVGDWIIKGVAGEFYPCKSEIFLQTYEPANTDVPLPSVSDGEAP